MPDTKISDDPLANPLTGEELIPVVQGATNKHATPEQFAEFMRHVFAVAVSDETTALTSGTGKLTFHWPFTGEILDVWAGLTVVQSSGSIFTVDVNDAGVSMLSTKITIDNGEETSLTAATSSVLSDSFVVKGAKATIDIDQVGDGTAKGLKLYFEYRRGISS